MLGHLADVSIRSLLLVALAAGALRIAGTRRTAALRHAVWASVVCGMLGLFAFGQLLPRLPVRVLGSDVETVSTASPATIAEPVSLAEVTQRSVVPAHGAYRQFSWADVAAWVYAMVALAFLLRLITGMFLVRRLMASGKRVDGFCESAHITVPFTLGWLRPKILLPVEWREWSSDKLAAVLTHEEAHVRRHDGLVGLLAGVNRCLFWFHPLAWVLERRLALLAEQACDEACVAVLGDRTGYARLLVEMASVIDGSQRRLRYHALTMAAAPHLRQRVDSLMAEGRTFSRGLGRAGWATVLVCGVPLLLGAGAVELKKAPPLLQMELPRWNAPALPASGLKKGEPVLLAQAQLNVPSAPAPKFDSASIKTCEAGDGAGRVGRGGAGGRGFQAAPGSFFVHCMTVNEMIDFAHDHGAIETLVNDDTVPLAAGRIRGGPSWAAAEYYTIDARTADPAANEPVPWPDFVRNPGFRLMGGPMLLTLLQDRFQLKIHTTVDQVPMYALSVGPAGIRLKPFEDGNCVNIENGIFPYPGGFKFGRDPKPPCNWIGWSVNGPNRTVEGGSVPLSRLASALGDFFMDRHVLDQTGVSTKFNLHLEYLPDEHTPMRLPDPSMAPDPTSSVQKAPTIFTAIEQQLGLKLESTSAPKGYIVIDGVERPGLN
jgi:uncharacterized protein (TIGR03435 family)